MRSARNKAFEDEEAKKIPYEVRPLLRFPGFWVCLGGGAEGVGEGGGVVRLVRPLRFGGLCIGRKLMGNVILSSWKRVADDIACYKRVGQYPYSLHSSLATKVAPSNLLTLT